MVWTTASLPTSGLHSTCASSVTACIARINAPLPSTKVSSGSSLSSTEIVSEVACALHLRSLDWRNVRPRCSTGSCPQTVAICMAMAIVLAMSLSLPVMSPPEHVVRDPEIMPPIRTTSQQLDSPSAQLQLPCPQGRGINSSSENPSLLTRVAMFSRVYETDHVSSSQLRTA